MEAFVKRRGYNFGRHGYASVCGFPAGEAVHARALHQPLPWEEHHVRWNVQDGQPHPRAGKGSDDSDGRVRSHDGARIRALGVMVPSSALLESVRVFACGTVHGTR